MDNNFERLGIMLDCSRNGVMTPASVKRFIDIISRLGYNCLMLYTEDTYEIKGEPYFGHNRGRYSGDEIKDIDHYAASKGIELIPCIQTLAHLERIFRWEEYQNIRDTGPILLADNEDTYKLIEAMFESIAENFTSRTVNIGMDEAHMLGRGVYMDKNGYHNIFDILLKHLNRVSEIAKKYNMQLIMWGDMFLGNELYLRIMREQPFEVEELYRAQKKKELIPDNVNLIYWDYYSKKDEIYDTLMTAFTAYKENIWFAGGFWSWLGFAPNNQYTRLVTEKGLRHSKEHGIKNVFFTMWGDNGNECSKFSLLPSIYFAACYAKGITDMQEIKSGFYNEFGIEFDDFMLLDLPGTFNDRYGYTIDSEKYLFYNDCFMGLFDSLISEGDGQKFGALVPKLEKLCKDPQFGYLFETLKQLCKVLELKTEIGIRTRKAYENRNNNELRLLSADYDKLLALLKGFYEAFEKQWMYDNKPHGFDVQDIRIGGLLQRIEHCKKRMLQYLNGELESISELEEPLLDIACRKEGGKEPVLYNNWATNVTSNGI